jgi:hypothetical protein
LAFSGHILHTAPKENVILHDNKNKAKAIIFESAGKGVTQKIIHWQKNNREKGFDYLFQQLCAVWGAPHF